MPAFVLILAACACTADAPLISPATAAPAINVFDVMLTFLVGLLVFARLRSGAKPPGADQRIGTNVVERSYTRARGVFITLLLPFWEARV